MLIYYFCYDANVILIYLHVNLTLLFFKHREVRNWPTLLLPIPALLLAQQCFSSFRYLPVQLMCMKGTVETDMSIFKKNKFLLSVLMLTLTLLNPIQKVTTNWM